MREEPVMTILAQQASKATAVALTSLVTLIALGGAAFAGPAPLDEGGRAVEGGGGTPPPTDTGTDWTMWGVYAGVALIVVGLVALTSILTVRHRHAGAHA